MAKTLFSWLSYPLFLSLPPSLPPKHCYLFFPTSRLPKKIAFLNGNKCPQTQVLKTYDESLHIELLQLATLLVRYLKEQLVSHRKELIKFAWDRS